MAQEYAFFAMVQFLEEEEKIKNERIERRTLRDQLNIFNIPEDRFIEVYRLNQDMTRYLLDELRPHIPCGRTSRALSLETKVLTALHFYGQGSYQKSVSKDRHLSLSQSCVSRCIAEVSAAITMHLSPKLIKYPNTDREILNAQENFYRRYEFPGVIGCVDGTHILVKGPSDEDIRLAYYNRKGDYSINTQIVCGADAEILSINARHPGSVHDAAIWETSSTRIACMQNRRQGVWLLGDSGYPQESWLMTPVMGDQTEATARYNQRHKSTRNCVERTIGYLKLKFRCLFKQRGLAYKHRAAGQIIYACAALHNLCLRGGLYEADLVLEEEEDVLEDQVINEHRAAGVAVRNNLINRYFR